jgi:hypothetical protein
LSPIIMMIFRRARRVPVAKVSMWSDPWVRWELYRR